jgi:hypothetical protein
VCCTVALHHLGKAALFLQHLISAVCYDLRHKERELLCMGSCFYLGQGQRAN